MFPQRRRRHCELWRSSHRDVDRAQAAAERQASCAAAMSTMAHLAKRALQGRTGKPATPDVDLKGRGELDAEHKRRAKRHPRKREPS